MAPANALDDDKASEAQKQAWIDFVNWMAHSDPSPYNAKSHPYGYTGRELDTPVTYGAYRFKGFDPPGYKGTENPSGITLKGLTISDFAKTNNISSTMCNLTHDLKGGYDKFSEEKNYSKNRYVMYEGEIYQFNKDHSAGAWDANDVNLIYSEFDPQSGYSVDDKVMHDEKVYVFVENHATGTDWNASEVNEVFGYLWSDGNFRTAFVPAYGQIYALYLVRTIVGKVIETIFNERMISIDSGGWWSSTQYSADVGVKLYNGGFNHYNKRGGAYVLPVLAY